MGWLAGKTGYDVVDEKIEKIEQEIANRVYRLWLKPEGETTIVFMDDKPPIIEDHQLKIGDSWQNWFTCLEVLGQPCIACAGDKAYTAAFYSILELVEFNTKDSTHVVNPLRVLCAKFQLMKQLKAESKLRGGLRGCMYTVGRSDGSAANTGDEWTFVRKLSDEELSALNKDAQPVDWETYLAPKSPEELAVIMGKAEDKDTARGGNSRGGSSAPRGGQVAYNEDEVNF